MYNLIENFFEGISLGRRNATLTARESYFTSASPDLLKSENGPAYVCANELVDETSRNPAFDLGRLVAQWIWSPREI